MLRLREIEERDLLDINKWRNDPELITCLGAPYRYINIEVEKKWFASYMNNRLNQIRCAVVDDEDVILGLVSLVQIDYINRCAEFHIMIGDSKNQGRGIGTYAVNAMLKHAFFNLNLNRVELAVLENNVKARRLYEKSGFVKEGTKRNAKYKNGVYYDMNIYSVLKEEYIKMNK